MATSTPPSSTSTTHPIAIIGGGLGGLALAIGLLKRNIPVRIYESTAAFSEIGAGVTFGVNSVAALRLVDERLLEGYRRHATFNEDEERKGTFLSLRWGVDGRGGKGGGEEGGSEEGESAKAGDLLFHLEEKWNPQLAQSMGVKPRSCIHRARLMEELVSLLPPDITTFSKTFVRAEDLDSRTVKVHFSDGTSILASAVIGCDGIKSKVRDFISPPNAPANIQPSYAHESAYRAVVPRQEAEASLGAHLALNGQIYCGYGGYIITYPISHGAYINMVLMPHDDNTHNNPVNTTSHDEWTVPTTALDLRAQFAGWFEPLIDLAARHLLPSKWRLFDLHLDQPYFRHRVCLLGDSAHASTPHLGAGAGMAMEDAYVLSSLIAEVRQGVNDNDDDDDDGISRAFWAYDKVRRPRTQQVVKRSREVYLGYAFMLQGVGDDVDKLKGRVEEAFKWLWHEDLVGQVHRAKKLLCGEGACA